VNDDDNDNDNDDDNVKVRGRRPADMRVINLIVVHCSDSLFGDAALVRKWHLERGFSEIGYHHVILNGYPDAESLRLHRPKFWLDGAVEPGRPLEQAGAHVQGHNHNSVGICLIGKEQFTQQQFGALVELIGRIRREHPGARLAGHYELLGAGDPPKSCPNLDMEWVRGQLGAWRGQINVTDNVKGRT